LRAATPPKEACTNKTGLARWTAPCGHVVHNTRTNKNGQKQARLAQQNSHEAALQEPDNQKSQSVTAASWLKWMVPSLKPPLSCNIVKRAVIVVGNSRSSGQASMLAAREKSQAPEASKNAASSMSWGTKTNRAYAYPSRRANSVACPTKTGHDSNTLASANKQNVQPEKRKTSRRSKKMTSG
jgi:hypothetical protein